MVMVTRSLTQTKKKKRKEAAICPGTLNYRAALVLVSGGYDPLLMNEARLNSPLHCILLELLAASSALHADTP